MIEYPAQREAADKASSLFCVSTPLPGDFHGGYESRYKQLLRRCAQAGIDPHKLRKRTAGMLFPSPARSGFAGEEIEAVASSFPSRRLSAAGSIDRSTARRSEM